VSKYCQIILVLKSNVYYLAFLLEITTFIVALVFTYSDLSKQRLNPDRFKLKPPDTAESKPKSDVSSDEKSEKDKTERKTPSPEKTKQSSSEAETEKESEKEEKDEKTEKDDLSEKEKDGAERKSGLGAAGTPVSGWLANRKM